MKISAADSHRITTIRSVNLIQLTSAQDKINSKLEVFFDEVVLAPGGRKISQGWLNDPLVLDFSNPKIVQALSLIEEVIKTAERERIISGYIVAPSPTPTLAPARVLGSPTATPSSRPT